MCIFCGGACGGIGETLAYPLIGSGLAYVTLKIKTGSFLGWRREKSAKNEYEEPLDSTDPEPDN